MKLGKPIINLFCIDHSEGRYGLHVVTFMCGTGWRAVLVSYVTPDLDTNGNCVVTLQIQEVEAHYPYITPVAHTFEVDMEECTSGRIKVQLEMIMLDEQTLSGGKGSVHMEDVDSGGLGDGCD